MSLAQLVQRLQRRGQVVNMATAVTVAHESAPAPAPPPPEMPLEPVAPLVVVAVDPVDWRVLDAAYMAHHVNCLTCQAAGRGVSYSLRCGTGAALWREYEGVAMQGVNKVRNTW
jgi:hypothetical protein